MTQPLIRILQIDSDELSLTIRTEIQTGVVLDDVSNVSVPNPIENQVLSFAGSPIGWIAVANVAAGLGAVVLGSPITKGDFLVYQGSPSVWVNTNVISLTGDRIILSGVSVTGSPAGSPPTTSMNDTSLEISSTLPGIMLEDTDGASNEKVWRFIVTGGDLVGEMRSDSGTSSNRWLEVIRNGIQDSEFSLFVGTEETAIRAIDGAAVEFYHNNIKVVETATSAEGSLRVLVGAGFERVLTESDIEGAGSPTTATIGDILFYNGTDWANLPRGTADQVLTMGSPLIPSWVTQAPANIIGGDGIDVTTGSPQAIVAVDSTVARISTGSPGIINVGTLIIDTVDFGARSTITTFETTTTTTSQTVIASFATAIYRSAEFLVEAVQGNNFHITKLLVTHDDTNAVSTEYGTVATPEFFGSPTTGSPAISGEQATFTVDISGGNLRLLATPVSSVSTVFTTTATLTKTKV